MVPPLNIDFWTAFYETSEDDEQTYRSTLEQTDDVVQRAELLWDWKDLGRGVDFETVRPVLEATSIDTYLQRPPSTAVETLGQRLVEGGSLSNPTVVTPAFLLHLADSTPKHYSQRFPIFDARVWAAYVLLTGYRDDGQSLPAAATSSTDKYGDFVMFFQQTIPDDVDGRTYERALFRFGSYINRCPGEMIADIRSHLSSLETSIEQYADQSGHYLVS